MMIHLEKWSACVVMALGASMSIGVPHARGQGICCVNTQDVTITCYGPGCKQVTTIVQCSGGYGSGQFYQSKKYTCCGSDITSLVNPSGHCQASPTRRTSALATRRVFVRDCSGRYVLVRVATES